jgi:hypothetical protein
MTAKIPWPTLYYVNLKNVWAIKNKIVVVKSSYFHIARLVPVIFEVVCFDIVKQIANSTKFVKIERETFSKRIKRLSLRIKAPLFPNCFVLL